VNYQSASRLTLQDGFMTRCKERPSPHRNQCHADAGESGLCAPQISHHIVNHYNVQPVFDILADVDRRDVGSVAKRFRK